MIGYNYPEFGAWGLNLGYFAWGCKCSSGLFWKPAPCAPRKIPTAIPLWGGYAYSQLLVYAHYCLDAILYWSF